MQRLGWLVIALCAMQVTSMPVLNEMSPDDTRVMKCVVEVISDTLSKPNAVPISPECLQTLRGDERIISILRHQNLLKELQQLAAKGASEKARQQKKSSGYPEELSKALEHTGDVDSDTEREKYKEITTEDSTISSTEVHEENNERDREKNTSEEERNSVEDSEPSEHDVTPEEEEDENKEADEPMESNEIGEQEEAVTDEGIDNHITDDINAGEVSEEKHQEENTHESQELKEEEEHVTKKHHEDAEEYASDDHEEQRSASEIENLAESKNKASQEDMEDETQSKNEDLDKTEDALDAEKKKSSESEEKSQEDDGGIHHLQNDMRHKEDSSQVKESRSEETELSSSKELENSKRWNKMDELAKELTSKKRNVDNESEEEEEDSDRSMKVPLRARKFDFNSRERDTRRSWPHHSNEDSGERILETAFRPTPEEKKDEEGSANRRAEDQELTSLSAIEKELEQVAHKLHELRRV